MSEAFKKLEEELDQLLAEAGGELSNTSDPRALEEVRVKFLGRRGRLNAYFATLAQETWTPEEKAGLGKKLNATKRELEESFAQASLSFQVKPPVAHEDLTLPGLAPRVGRSHPITQTIDEILGIFQGLGFSVVEGPEAETEYYNFEALNIPKEHPSRESFDTFYLDVAKGAAAGVRYLLRSHTSPMQIRFMEKHSPPFQIVVPGKVFRPDAVDASHSFQFHQVEGLAVGGGITFGDLKGVLISWARRMFGQPAHLRFRPHYFPFTEPSAEADLACIFCRGTSAGCRVCGGKGWLEILGCGMVHPNVFQAVNYPSGTVGFAFGMGVERIAMLKYGIEDIRLFFDNDLRFLSQFVGTVLSTG